ncbi:MAG: DUF484 family protein [Pseudomonadota bacterium]
MENSRAGSFSIPSSVPADQHQDRNLRHRLDEVLAEARQNERKLRRFQSLELQLIGLSSLCELIQAVVYPDPAATQWDMVTLLLIDPEYEIQRILEEEDVNLRDHPALIFTSDGNKLDALHPYSLFPMLGPYQPNRHAALFPLPKRPASVALLPMVRNGRLIGSLNIGSYSRERFIKGVRTDILEHYAAVVAICLENAANLERLKRQGLTDTLTAINNRRFFDQRLGEEIASATRSQRPLSCMLLDVDYFKKVNDSYGHQIGDQVLREVAAVIRSQLRGGDVLSRYGGEEFSALLAQTGADGAVDVAERIRKAVAEHRFTPPNGEQFSVTLSIGIATYNPEYTPPPAAMTGDTLIGHADHALYDAKAAGRNKVVNAGDVAAAQEGW